MTIENQFYPHRFEAALREAIAAQPALNLTESEQAALTQAIVGEVKNKFFFFHGDFGLWNDKEYIFVAAPFFALKKARWRQRKMGNIDSIPQTYAVVGQARKDKYYHFYEVPLSHFTDDLQLDANNLELYRNNLDSRKKSLKQNYLQIPRVSNLEDDTGIRLDISFKGYKHRRYPARQTLPYPKMKNLIRHIVFTGTLSAIPQGKRILASINELITALQTDCVEAYRTGWNALVDHLDRRAVEFVEAHNEHRTRDGHSVYDKLRSAPNEEIRGYREAAIGVFHRLGVTYDVLPNACIRYIRTQYDYDEIAIPLWEKIDQGLPALAALELVYPDTGKRWKSILKAGAPVPPMVGHQFASDKFDAEKRTELLNLAKPQTREEWQILDDLCSELEFANFGDDHVGVADYNPGFRPRHDIDLIEKTWRDGHNIRSWQQFYEELYATKHVRQIGAHRAEIRRQTRGIKDMIQNMYKNIVLPCALRTTRTFNVSTSTGLYAAFKRQLLDNMNLRHLLQGNDYWHSENVNFGGRVSSFGTDMADTWLPLVENVEAPIGVQFVALISKADLYAEATAMEHCVWSYTEQCVLGRNHILSIRDSEGRRLTTLQLQEIDLGTHMGVEIVQHLGWDNKAPSPQAVQAARWLENEINSGSIRPDFEAIQKRRDIMSHDQVQLILGFDYNDLSVCEDVYDLYVPCLPAKFQSTSKTVAGFLKTIGFDQILVQNGFQPPPQPLILPQNRRHQPRPN